MCQNLEGAPGAGPRVQGRQALSGPERGAECPVPCCACERPTAVQAGERWRRCPEQRRRSPAGSPARRTVGPCHWKHVEVLVGAAGDTKLEPLARRTPCCQRRGTRRNPRDQSCSDGVSGGPRGTAHMPGRRCGLAGPAGDSPRSRRLSVAGTRAKLDGEKWVGWAPRWRRPVRPSGTGPASRERGIRALEKQH